MCNNETGKIIDDLLIHAKITHGGETWQPLQDGTIDRIKWRTLLRRRIIEAVEHQFKEGLEFSDLGVIVHPGLMINLIGNYNENGEKAQPCPLPFLQHDLLPALKELVSYSETIKLAPKERHGLTTRIEAMRDDLTDALNTGDHKTREGSSA